MMAKLFLLLSQKLDYFNSEKVLSNIGIATARAGNIIGGGDWAKDRLIPDLVKSAFKNKNVVIRNPNSVRPWQHVFDVVNGYLLLTENLYKKPKIFSESWNFGPVSKNIKVKDVVSISLKKLESKSKYILNKEKSNHETNRLNLNSKKSMTRLKWKPKLDIDNSLNLTLEWYKTFFSKKNIVKISYKQIKNYF